MRNILCPGIDPVWTRKPVRRAFLSVYLISLAMILLGDNYIYLRQIRNGDSLQIGDIAEEDIFASQSFRYVDRDGTERLTSLRMASVNGIFVRQEGITREILGDIESFADQFDRLASEGAGTASFLALGFPLGADQITFLLEGELYRKIFRLTTEVCTFILNKGYFNLLGYRDDPSYGSGVVEVVGTEGDGIRTTLPAESLLSPSNLSPYVESTLKARGLENGELTIAQAMVNFFLKENCYFNEKMTAQKRDQVLTGIEPVYVNVEGGEKIVGLGEVVTSQVMQKLEAYRDQIGRFKIIPLFKSITYLSGLILLAFLLICHLPIEIGKTKNFLLVVWSFPFFLFILILFERIVHFESLRFHALLIPTGLFTLLVSQLVTSRKGVMIYAFLLSLLAFFISGLDAHVFLYSLITGMTGTLVLTGGEKRIDILKSGIWLGSVNLAVILYFDIIDGNSLPLTVLDGSLGFFSGIVYSLLVLSLLPLFEHFMNSCTAYRLAELANLNEPILKRLFIQAAGTYVHSINVAYMAEPACEAIGCNSLLARVAAYYHDIGKMDQPEYFIENQKEANKHDELKANLSAAVIKAHVKLGVEKGREMNLPEEVIAIIGQHHGTSVIRYFYDKAEKEMKESGKSSVNREDYCHYGPRPQSKEAAVVMMADTIEAASRTLKKPSRAKLEKFVWDLIMNRLQTGELNDSGLTLNELEKIKESFVHVLVGHFHTRIEYPDQNQEENQ